MRKSAILPILLLAVILVGLASTAVLVSPYVRDALNRTSQGGGVPSFFQLGSPQRNQAAPTENGTAANGTPELTDEEYAVYSALISYEREIYIKSNLTVPRSYLVSDKAVSYLELTVDSFESFRKHENASLEVISDFISRNNGTTLPFNVSRFPPGTPNITLFDDKKMMEYVKECFREKISKCQNLYHNPDHPDQYNECMSMTECSNEEYPKGGGYSSTMILSIIGFNGNRTEAIVLSGFFRYFLRKENSVWKVYPREMRVTF